MTLSKNTMQKGNKINSQEQTLSAEDSHNICSPLPLLLANYIITSC